MTEFKPVTPEEAKEILEHTKSEGIIPTPKDSDHERMTRTIVAVGKALEEMESLERGAFERFREEEEDADWGQSCAYSRSALMLRVALGVKDA